MIYDHVLRMKPRHDVIGAGSMFRRMPFKHVFVLGDKGYDCEHLHQIAEQHGFLLHAPVRKSSRSLPNGKHRKRCARYSPPHKGKRSIAESVIRSLKVRIRTLRSRLHFMKKREFAWHIMTYNLEILVPQLLALLCRLLQVAY